MTKNNSSEKPVILITNDDSYSAAGIRKLISLMRPLGKVVVVASEHVMSGMGHAITIKTPLRMKRVALETDYEEYVCNGTPVDCVKLGTQVVLKSKPDLVVSGINHGSNASINVIYSGTMAAVLEACIDGIPAIGFSLLEYSMDADFSHVDEYVTKITRQVLKNGLPSGVCLNVNIPAVSVQKPKGIKVCRQSHARWVEEFDSRMDPRGTDYHWLTGQFENDDLDEDTDQFALENNFVSIVPVQYDLTAYHAINSLKEWDF
ncbi:MAG: 5'/3'-nucleotidase SurE [Bacteroidales bacterium]|jgi:5'-nucleotidase|nr:5'/3'-nucleotidase SurE [Bacteroidales bacterium]MDD4086766.1 5'/3'-nucleotidase SurE [Bacteroidales bacterium]MDY0085629.1 5'/3'-nucleotidase SurE [Bacteroidales bacterium]